MPESQRHADNDGVGIHHHKSKQSHTKNYLINAVEHLSITPEDHRITPKPVQTAQYSNVSFTHLLMAAVRFVHLQVAAAAAAAVANSVH